MKQTFNVPENCTAIVEQTGDKIVITFEHKKVEFKKGDIVALQYTNRNYVSYVCIFSDKKCLSGINRNGEFIFEGIAPDFDLMKINAADKSQRQLLIDKLESEGWKFNEEKCELEKIKWTPEISDNYEFINVLGKLTNVENNCDPHDYDLISAGNCFKPNQLDLKKVKQLYAEFIEKVKKEHGINY